MNLHQLLLTVDTLCIESQVRYFDSFIAIETYICMTSMMMLNITMEVYVNKSLPIKGKTQAKPGHFLVIPGHFWKLLDTPWYFRHVGIGFDETLLF